jgi:hypothetical protein
VSEGLANASRCMFVHSPALRIEVDAERRGRRGVVALTYRKNLIRTHLRQSSGSACSTGWSVGAVIARRGVLTGLGSNDGSGRYHVQFDGVPKSVHVQLMRNFCQCNAHIKMLRHLGRRMKGALDQSVVQLLAKAQRDCESAHLQALLKLRSSSRVTPGAASTATTCSIMPAYRAPITSLTNTTT